jgi:hypothetical protein
MQLGHSLVAITRTVLEQRGAMTWDVPVQANGLMAAPFLEQLSVLRDALGPPALAP